MRALDSLQSFCECFFLFVHYFEFTHENRESEQHEAEERTGQALFLLCSRFFFTFLFFRFRAHFVLIVCCGCIIFAVVFPPYSFHCLLSLSLALSLSLVRYVIPKRVHFKGIFRRAAPLHFLQSYSISRSLTLIIFGNNHRAPSSSLSQ